MREEGSSHRSASDQLAKLVGGAIVLVMLDYGRDVIIPIALAVFLALFLAPMIRRLRHWGLGQGQAVTVAVLLLFVIVSATTVVLASQAIRLAGSLPQYEQTIRSKLQDLDRLTLGKLNVIVNQADRMVGKLSPESSRKPVQPALQGQDARQPLRVQIEEPHAKPFDILSKIIKVVLPPLEMAGIVVIVLVFILLDYELLRDRIIRLVGGGNLRTTTQAITDATERLSRFFVSQFAVNALVGALVAAGLGLAGLDGALFWGGLTAVSRFIPYVGIWLAAGAATVMAGAMSDGWTLMVQTVLVYLFIEIVIAQYFEPKLYGHSTGLSPLAVVISAIFWSALWGPVGLILSTPLTLCLVVLGRHVRALNFLELLLGDLSALTQAERFYQRALSGDSAELVRGLKKFLREKTLTQYCDHVLLAAIRLAYDDFSTHEITQAEQKRMAGAILGLIDAMSSRGLHKSRGKGSALDTTTSGVRRKVNLPAGRRLLVVELGHEVSDLIAKVMLSVFDSENLDARYSTVEALSEVEMESGIAVVFVVCVAPEDHARKLAETLSELRQRLPMARLVVMRVLEEVDAPYARPTAAEAGADAMVGGYQAAVDISYELLATDV
jgi:predicted PurR-regulated permease PerM